MESAFDLTEQRILITGAAGGIGAMTARVCAALGAELHLVDQRETEPLARELRAAGTKVAALTCVVSSMAEVEAVAASSGPVDALILAAGLCPWDDWQEPGWDEVFERGRSLHRNRRIQRTAPLPWVHSRACIPVVVRNLVLRAERLGRAASQSIEPQEAVFHTRIGSRRGQPFKSQFVEAEEATREESPSSSLDCSGDS
jgi:NAD(P)-dependent dehydrogenase (short-subunit alcohol dehydrogenase family)